MKKLINRCIYCLEKIFEDRCEKGHYQNYIDGTLSGLYKKSIDRTYSLYCDEDEDCENDY